MSEGNGVTSFNENRFLWSSRTKWKEEKTRKVACSIDLFCFEEQRSAEWFDQRTEKRATLFSLRSIKVLRKSSIEKSRQTRTGWTTFLRRFVDKDPKIDGKLVRASSIDNRVKTKCRTIEIDLSDCFRLTKKTSKVDFDRRFDSIDRHDMSTFAMIGFDLKSMVKMSNDLCTRNKRQSRSRPKKINDGNRWRKKKIVVFHLFFMLNFSVVLSVFVCWIDVILVDKNDEPF